MATTFSISIFHKLLCIHIGMTLNTLCFHIYTLQLMSISVQKTNITKVPLITCLRVFHDQVTLCLKCIFILSRII
uniref:Uncharacterized protein n=1 Tax=Populus trichocarpa TaxID=3694 RepID=A0A2K1WWY3_POPTR